MVVFGKKPRKSKTSEIVEVEDLSFYLYNTKSNTKGNCEIYLMSEPYPLIKVSESNEKAKLWLSNNIIRVKAKLATMSISDTITRDEFIKNDKPEDEVIGNSLTIEECQAMHNKIKEEING